MGTHSGPPRPRQPVSTVTSRTNPASIRRGILAGVGPSTDNPTFCSVFFDGRTPPFNGFRLPAGSGPILPFGTDTYKGQPFSGPYYSADPVNIGEGTQVLVDMDTMCVIAIQHGSMSPIASKGEVLVGTHTHTGGYDSTGNVMPLPIDGPQLAQNPNPTTAPNVTSGATSFTYTDVGSMSYDAEFSFTLDTANPSWLRYIALYVVKNGSTVPGDQTSIYSHILPNGTGSYTIDLKTVVAGRAYDIYIAYRDHAGLLSPPTLLGTTAANPAVVGLPTMPSGIKSAGPTVTGFTVSRAAGVGVSHELAYSITETDFTSTVPSWLAALEVVTRRNGLSNVSLSKTIDPSSSTTGVYTGSIVGFAGTSEDIGVRYVGVDGEKSAIYWGVTGKSDPNGDFVSVTDGTVTFLRHHAAVQNTLTSTAGGDGKYLASGTILDRHISSVKVDTLTDGSYAKVKATELTGGTVKQLNDGTNVRTAAHVAGAIDTSSRIVGSIYDGVNSRTPSAITSTVQSSGGIDFASALHANKTLDNVGDGGTYARPLGVTLNRITLKSLIGDTSSDTSTLLVDGSNKRFLHTAMSTGVQSAIDSSGNLLNISWTGIKVGSGGALSGFTSAGSSSSQALSLTSGQVISFEAQFQLAATGSDMRFVLGSATNAYGLQWVGSTGVVRLIKDVAGTITSLGTIATVAQDTNVHTFKFTVTVGATNVVEGSFDAYSPVTSAGDSALTLTTGTWPFTISDGQNGATKFWGLIFKSSKVHYTELHPAVKTAVDTSGRVIGSVYDGTTTLSPANFTSVITTSGTVDVSKPKAGVTLPRTAHDPSITGAIDSSSRVVGSIYDGTTVLTPANFTSVITTAGTVDVSKPKSGVTLPRTAHDPSITGAIDSSSRLVSSVYDGATALSPANLTSAVTNTGLVKVANATGTLPRANHDPSITGAIDSSSRLVGAIYDGTNSRTPANVTAALDGSGRLIGSIYDGTTALAPSVFTSVLDTSGNIKNNPFNASGVVLTANGELTGFHTTGSSTHTTYAVNTSGCIVNVAARIRLAAAGTDCGVILGTNVGGYALVWNGSTGSLDMGYYNSLGSFIVLQNLGTVAQDTNWHAFKLSVTNISGAAYVEASWDNLSVGPILDAHVVLSAQRPVTVFMPSTGLLIDLDVEAALPHYSEMHAAVRTAVDTSGRVVGSIYDGATTLTPSNVTDVIGTYSGHGRVNVNPLGGVVGNLPLANHASDVTTVIKTGGVFDATKAQTGTLLPYGNLSSTITGTIDSSGNLDVTKVQAGKTLPRMALDSSVTGAINSDGSLNAVPFPGVKLTNSGYWTNFTVGGVTSSLTYGLDNTGALVVQAQIANGAPGTNNTELIIGNRTNGYGVRWDTTGAMKLYKYSSGSPSVLTTIQTGMTQDSALHSYRIVIDGGSGQPNIEAAIDSQFVTPFFDSGWTAWPTPTVTIDAGGTAGTVTGYQVNYRLLYSAVAEPYQKVVWPTPDTNGSYLAWNTVGPNQVQPGTLTNACLAAWAVQGSGSGAVGTNVIKANSIGAGDIGGMTGSGNVSLDNLPDGTSYARVSAKNLNSGNLGTIWNSTSIYKDTNECYAGFGNGTQVSTTAAFPITAAFPWTVSGCVQSGGSSSNIFVLFGNQTNGIGFRWNTGGTVSLAVFKAGTGTFTTIATVTRDTTLHWFSIKVTPGTTPGTSDAYVIYFDKSTLSGTTGSSAVTWGSTANVSVQLSNTTSTLSQFRIGSQGGA